MYETAQIWRFESHIFEIAGNPQNHETIELATPTKCKYNIALFLLSIVHGGYVSGSEMTFDRYASLQVYVKC